jgi:hypothetical protein
MNSSLRIGFNQHTKEFEFHICYPEKPEWDRQIGCISVDDLAKRGSAIAERDVGRMVLGAFDAESGLASSRDERIIELEEMIEGAHADLRLNSANGDVEAMFALASATIGLAYRRNDLELLEEAERQLKEVAARGWQEAKEFLSGAWPEAKLDYQQQIKENLKRRQMPS